MRCLIGKETQRGNHFLSLGRDLTPGKEGGFYLVALGKRALESSQKIRKANENSMYLYLFFTIKDVICALPPT